MDSDSTRLFSNSSSSDTQAVECLGISFDSESERREHFRSILREKLNDPAFRQIEGFPKADDDDIIALSDPPYYTACPNPFIREAVEKYGTPFDRELEYKVAPLAADVSSGKGDKNYYIHSYHTKVPPTAIAEYIEHYSDDGGIILDCFSGSGMTALGTALVHKDRASTLLFDICTSAAFISYFHSRFRPSLDDFEAFEVIIKELRKDFGQWYLTDDTGWPSSVEAPADWQTFTSGKSHPRTVKYVVWSVEVSCPECGKVMPLWEFCVDLPNNESHSVFSCPSCDKSLAFERKHAKKANAQLVEPVYETVIDQQLREPWRRIKRSPVFVSYLNGRKRFEKCPTNADLKSIAEAEELPVADWCPIQRMPDGDEARRNDEAGLTHTHHFFPARTLHVLARAATLLRQHNPAMLGLLTSVMQRCSWQNRYMPQHRGNRSREVVGPLSGTLYVPYFALEINPIEYLNDKGTSALKLLSRLPKTRAFISNQSATSMSSVLPKSCVDVVFIDPPFGSNLQYSELGFVMESWLKVVTGREKEAVVNTNRNLTVEKYTHRMRECLEQVYSATKPGRWVTVEFHNSQNAIWTAIQVALNEAGFVIADVRTLDKKKGTTKQLTLANTVKQDLIIAAYRPDSDFEERFSISAGKEDGVWEFLNSHLEQLPVCVETKTSALESLAEREAFMLFNRTVAFHLQRGISLPLSAAEFYEKVAQRYPVRDGMHFLPEQVSQYEKKRITASDIVQLELFVNNESSAIQWLKKVLSAKPQTFQEIQPAFMREVAGWDKHEKPIEVASLLEQNFICYDGSGDVPGQIHSYLSSNFHDLRNLDKDDDRLIAKAKNRWYVPDPRKEQDLEKIRNRALLKEFEEYKSGRGKLAKVRIEALRAGFKECYANQDFVTIVSIGKRVKDAVIQEDAGLLFYHDNAVMLTEG